MFVAAAPAMRIVGLDRWSAIERRFDVERADVLSANLLQPHSEIAASMVRPLCGVKS